jgi:hypothetical protein
MKAVILFAAPNARIVDLTHAVRPQDVLQGAFLQDGLALFSEGTVHLAVIDQVLVLREKARGSCEATPSWARQRLALQRLADKPVVRARVEGRATRRVVLPSSTGRLARLRASRCPSATFEGRCLCSGCSASGGRYAVVRLELWWSIWRPFLPFALQGRGQSRGRALRGHIWQPDHRHPRLDPLIRIQVTGRELGLSHLRDWRALAPSRAARLRRDRSAHGSRDA